jgi:hypothetical protein
MNRLASAADRAVIPHASRRGFLICKRRSENPSLEATE